MRLHRTRGQTTGQKKSFNYNSDFAIWKSKSVHGREVVTIPGTCAICNKKEHDHARLKKFENASKAMKCYACIF